MLFLQVGARGISGVQAVQVLFLFFLGFLYFGLKIMCGLKFVLVSVNLLVPLRFHPEKLCQLIPWLINHHF